MTSLAFRRSCVSTHLARTGEIGHASVTGIEKKGKINRRVRIALATP
jgi:misacylated tRNA(Ala) deacylase